ncbi:MAG: XamI family restriction endonuclease [Alphaproteobacteria bacterium]|nr:XamI family restriction endonuclease [Alphaproteobacteria bacterium]
MILPLKWTQEQLAADANKAREAFRHERLDEPLELYSQQFQKFSILFSALIDRIPELKAAKLDGSIIADLMGDEDHRRAFCYLSAPPISEDDLRTLAEASLSPGTLRRRPEDASRIRDIIFRIMDPHRFPWVMQGRLPNAEEKAAAIVASAALVAARKVETFRRNDAKDRQEQKVKDLLVKLGFTEVKKRKIPTAAQAPKPSEFMGEAALAGAKADVIATLSDGRILAIECKVSNSAVNSYKRLVHDTGGKATIWYDQLGRANVLAMAVMSGVFSPANCMTVQNDKNVFLFWDFRLEDLAQFIENTRKST